MTKKEREALLTKHARSVAKLYRDLAAELEQAAKVLDHAGDLHAAYPVVSTGRFCDAMQAGAVLHYILDAR